MVTGWINQHQWLEFIQGLHQGPCRKMLDCKTRQEHRMQRVLFTIRADLTYQISICKYLFLELNLIERL